MSSAVWVGQSKDAAYVKNVVSWYRRQLDAALAGRDLVRSSSGHSHVDFEPDVTNTFNHGYTTYFLHGNKRSGEPPGAIESPKMVGERVGTVHTVDGDQVTIATDLVLHSGDGLTWFDPQPELTGTLVNAVEPRGNRVQVTVEDTRDLRPGGDHLSQPRPRLPAAGGAKPARVRNGCLAVARDGAGRIPLLRMRNRSWILRATW